MQRLGPAQELLVEVRAVRRAEVLDHRDPSLALHARVSGRGERVLEDDLDVATPERRAAGDVVARAALVAGGALDDEQDPVAGRGLVDAGGLGRQRRGLRADAVAVL